jgi:hypothetical protein
VVLRFTAGDGVATEEGRPKSRTPTRWALARFPRRRWLHRASEVAPVRVWCRVNVHLLCHAVNTRSCVLLN